MKRVLLAMFALLVVMFAPRRTEACVLDGVNAVAFGNYDVYANSDVAVLGGVRYHCIISLSIRIDISTGSSGSYAMRKMTRTAGGTDTLSYQLFTDASGAPAAVWGNGTTGTTRYGPVLGLLTNTTVPIYAILYKKQNVQTGAYSDTVVVTLNY